MDDIRSAAGEKGSPAPGSASGSRAQSPVKGGKSIEDSLIQSVEIDLGDF